MLDPFRHSQAPTTPLTTIQAVLSFDKWGMDLLRPFLPASGERKFLIVAINYFTKLTEAEPLPSITNRQVQAFICRNIITRFGVPRALVSDNGKQFNNGPSRDYYARLGIQTKFSVVSRPQTNGQAESANKIVLKGINKSLEAAKGAWVGDLLGVLWSAQTKIKEATRHSLFALVNGSEAVGTPSRSQHTLPSDDFLRVLKEQIRKIYQFGFATRDSR